MSAHHPPVYDITDLKEKIAKLREVQKQRILERQQYEAKITEKESLLQRMKQEHTILAPDLELRYHNNTTAAAAASVVLSQAPSVVRGGRGEDSKAFQLSDAILDKDLIDDKRFRIWNEKLEMQILLQEIRQVLPSLEEQVKFYEKLTQKHKKHLIKKEIKTIQPPRLPSSRKKGESSAADVVSVASVDDEEIPEFATPMLLLKAEDCQQSIERIMKEIIDYKVTKRTMIEKQKQANQQLVQKLNFVRKEIQQKLSQKLALKKFILKFQKDVLLEEKRKEVVTKNFLDLRKECEDKGQYLWQTAVFKNETDNSINIGSESGRMSMDRVVPILSKWLCVRNAQILWTSPEFLKRLTTEIVQQNKRYQRKSFSQDFSSVLNENKQAESKDRRGEEGKYEENQDLDLVTFCLLSNQLILLLE